VGSSSRRDKGDWCAPANAFDPNNENGWYSGQDSTGGGGTIFPFPHLIWYDFQHRSFVPAEIGISTSNYNYGPSKWQLIGSNDVECGEFSAWTILCEDVSGGQFRSTAESKFCHVVDAKPKEVFRCLGIRVLESPYDKYASTSILDIRLWEKVAPTFG